MASKSTKALRTGTGGPVFVQAPPEPSPLAPAFLAAAQSIGIQIFANQNGTLQEGPGGGTLTNVRIRGGRQTFRRRCSDCRF
jgi:choline dehydrogenase